MQGQDGWYISAVNVTLIAYDNLSGVAAIWFKVDNGSWGAYVGPIPLGGGRHSVQFYATDLAGLTEPNQTLSVEIDTDTPATVGTVDGTTGNNVIVTLTANDNLSGVAAIWFKVDNGSWTRYGSPIHLGDGRHTVQFYATDLAGLTESNQTLSVEIDTETPGTVGTVDGTTGNNG